MKINLKDTIHSGQVFLWEEAGGFWYGIDGQDVLKVDHLANIESFRQRRVDLFRRSDDMPKIIRSITRDGATAAAVRQYPGLRIMDQDPFQCLISFIASSNSSIQKIRNSLGRLAAKFGRQVRLDGMDFSLFPSPDVLAGATAGQIAKCGFGYRSKFIKSAASMVSQGQVGLERLKRAGYDEAKRELLCIPGVGSKVADCVMLFSLGKLEAFPLDRWTIRILAEYGPGFRLDGCLTDKRYDALHQKIKSHFGPYAGYAQQYLFKMYREDSGKRW